MYADAIPGFTLVRKYLYGPEGPGKEGSVNDAVHFYRDVLRLKEISSGNSDDTPRFKFDDKVLWLNCDPGISQAQIWLEIY